jgi:NAD(P)-dependent dehydrogenase (short-subunit alcohol dehydrogenase family)
MTSYLASEAVQRGVLVNTVLPGLVLTSGHLEGHDAVAAEKGIDDLLGGQGGDHR